MHGWITTAALDDPKDRSSSYDSTIVSLLETNLSLVVEIDKKSTLAGKETNWIKLLKKSPNFKLFITVPHTSNLCVVVKIIVLASFRKSFIKTKSGKKAGAHMFTFT